VLIVTGMTTTELALGSFKGARNSPAQLWSNTLVAPGMKGGGPPHLWKGWTVCARTRFAWQWAWCPRLPTTVFRCRPGDPSSILIPSSQNKCAKHTRLPAGDIATHLEKIGASDVVSRQNGG
jgi:hypothetical protein